MSNSSSPRALGVSSSSRALEIAVKQHGVVTRRQLHKVGVAPRTLYRLIESGYWVAHGRRVLVLRGTETDFATRSRIAGLQIKNAVLTGDSALVVRGEIWPLSRRNGGRPWLISRSRPYVNARFLRHPSIRWGWLGPWRVAVTADALIDLIRFLPLSEGRNVGYRAIQSGIVTVDALSAAHDQLKRHDGSDRLAIVLRDVSTGAHSDAERRLITILERTTIAGWLPNYRISLGTGHIFIDLAFPESRLAIEVDGRAWHSDAKQFVADRRRQNLLSTAGWTVLRFTWEDLTQRPDYVVTEIQSCLDRLQK